MHTSLQNACKQRAGQRHRVWAHLKSIRCMHTAHTNPHTEANDAKVYLPSLLRVRGIRKMYAQNLHTIQSVNILIA